MDLNDRFNVNIKELISDILKYQVLCNYTLLNNTIQAGAINNKLL
jgi:hypothetical protein